MLQGKPALVFGNDRAAVPVPAKVKAGARSGGKDGPDFASFLPEAVRTLSAARSGPSALEEAPGEPGLPGRGAALNPAQAGKSFFAGAVPSPAADKGSPVTPGNSPGGGDLLRGASRSLLRSFFGGSGSAGTTEASRPAVAAQAENRAGQTNFTAVPRRAGREGKARLSGRPVTGRGGIGMEDTRKTRGAAPAAAPDASPRRAVSLERNDPALPEGMIFSLSQVYSLQSPGFAGEGRGGNVRGTAAPKAVEPSDELLQNLRSLPGGMVFGAARPVSFPQAEEGASMAVRAASHKRSPQASSPSPGDPLVRAMRRFGAEIRQDLGSLAAKFESGAEGIAAVGYDRHGGTSYGKFQISSRAGTMNKFLRYLEDAAPDLAARLASCGPANTGGRAGKMPEAWKDIAAEDPQRFERLQNDFIRESHFEPALQRLTESTGILFEALPAALQEVVFSTAVQHGPGGAFRIISRALSRMGEGKFGNAQKSPETSKQAGEELIRQIYAIRAGQFASSTREVQAAAKERLRLEMREALTLLM